MLDPSNYDPRPLRVRIYEALSHPQWLTTQELAKRLGDSMPCVSGVLSKLVTYGAMLNQPMIERRKRVAAHRGLPDHGKWEYRLRQRGRE